MMNAKEYRAMANKVNEETREKANKRAYDYIDVIVEPLVKSTANKGLYDVSIDVPTDVDIDLVAELLEEKYYFCVGWDSEEFEEGRVLNLMW